MKDTFQKIISRHAHAVERTFAAENLDSLEVITREILKALKAGNKLLFCGNGGSAADSQHIAAEFVGRYKIERQSLPAIALTTDTSILTAVANDYSYDDIFSRQVEGLGQKGDILFALSTSGNSANVLKAVQKAREKGILTIGMTGENGGALKNQCDICFSVASDVTSHVQEIHITTLHAVSEVVEGILFGV